LQNGTYCKDTTLRLPLRDRVYYVRKGAVKKKDNSLINRLFGKGNNTKEFRRVYFGIRSRFLALLSLVMVVIISFIAIILYQHQKEIIQDEKTSNAETLTRILSSPAELYLDRGVNPTDNEVKLKFELIEREAANFKAYNSDITKILITDEKGSVRFSTEKKDFGGSKKIRYIEKALNLQEDALQSYDPKDDKEYIRTLKKKQLPEPFIAIMYPIFLKTGLTVDVIQDYTKYYGQYHEAKSSQEKNKIYNTLYAKYKDVLGDDFLSAADKEKLKKTEARTASKFKGKAKGAPAPAIKDSEPKEDEITKEGDIDFMFHRLFTYTMESRAKQFLFPKKDLYLVSDKWLFDLKKQKLEAKKNDILARETEILTSIRSNITALANEVENSRRLGIIAVVFNTEKIEKNREKILSSIIIPFFGPVKGTTFITVIFLVIAVVFFFILHFMVKNIKKLETWAVAVAEGNLSNRIEIATQDEIGRVGDAFNHMLEEIVVKYHLEKFVSSSTKSMIIKQRTDKGDINLGVNERRTFAFIFSDIRGFTSFSEKNDPKTVIDVLNFYLELQSQIIKSSRGDIDDYVGDQIMAHFGGDKRADTAIDTALKMMKGINHANAERRKAGLPIFEVGIGIHGGDVVVGNVGSEFRMDYTCVGDAVNLTSRLCSAAAAGEILVSKELFEQAGKKFTHVKSAPISVKGKKDLIEIVKLVV
jgi:class 3 adenylate cyclase